MLFYTIGLPGRFSAWCHRVSELLIEDIAGEVASLTWPPVESMLDYGPVPSVLEEFAKLLIGRPGQHAAVSLRHPDQLLRRALTAGESRCLISLDDPRNALADLLSETDADLRLVTRAIANSCISPSQYEGFAGALVMASTYARDDSVAAVSAIAEHFGVPIEPEMASRIAKEAYPLWLASAPDRGEGLITRLRGPERRMIEGALLGYCDRFRGHQLDQIVWTRDLFVLGSDPGRTPDAPIEIVAGGFLVVGPFIQLPPGTWVAEVVLGFSQEAGGASFLIDVFDGRQIACITIRPERAGVYDANLTFSIYGQSESGIEVRIMPLGDRVAGRLAFGRVAVRPVAARQGASAEDEDFARVLAI